MRHPDERDNYLDAHRLSAKLQPLTSRWLSPHPFHESANFEIGDSNVGEVWPCPPRGRRERREERPGMILKVN